MYSQIIARSWADDAFAQELIAHPRKVLVAHGITVPEEVDIKVLPGQHDFALREGSPRPTLELPLPKRPADLDQASLQKVLEHWPGTYGWFC